MTGCPPRSDDRRPGRPRRPPPPTAPFLLVGAGSLTTAGAGAWAAGVYLALLPSALGFVLWGHAVARLPVAASTSLLYLVPAVAVVIAFGWLGEVPLPAELLGGAVVVLGVLLLTQGDRLLRRQRRRAPRRAWRRPFTSGARGAPLGHGDDDEGAERLGPGG